MLPTTLACCCRRAQGSDNPGEAVSRTSAEKPCMSANRPYGLMNRPCAVCDYAATVSSAAPAATRAHARTHARTPLAHVCTRSRSPLALVRGRCVLLLVCFCSHLPYHGRQDRPRDGAAPPDRPAAPGVRLGRLYAAALLAGPRLQGRRVGCAQGRHFPPVRERASVQRD